MFYILANQITTIFISLNLLTTMSFDSEIMSYLYGGPNEDIYFQVTNNNKTLAIKPKGDFHFSNLMVITKNQKYYFDLKMSKDNPHQFIEIKDGVMNHALTKKLETKDYEILEGDNSLLFVNKLENPIRVNGIEIKHKEYLSKGIPIIYEGKRILN